MDNFNVQSIVDEASSIGINELTQILENQIRPNFLIVKEAIMLFLNAADNYLKQTKTLYNRSYKKEMLITLKDTVLQTFFLMQNTINAYWNGQTITVAIVTKDNNNQRQIMVSENNVEDLIAIKAGVKSKSYRLSYTIRDHQKKLTNSFLSNSEIQILNNAANAVEKRWNNSLVNQIETNKILSSFSSTDILKQFIYERTSGKTSTYGKVVVWFPYDQVKGYQMTTRGPINEAFANHFINSVPLKGTGLEEYIDSFMLDDYGAVKADGKSGFMLGDISLGNMQFAIKGEGGGPENITDIYNELKLLVDQGLNERTLKSFIERYTTDLKNKEVVSQIRPLTNQAIQNLINIVGGKEQFKQQIINS